MWVCVWVCVFFTVLSKGEGEACWCFAASCHCNERYHVAARCSLLQPISEVNGDRQGNEALRGSWDGTWDVSVGWITATGRKHQSRRAPCRDCQQESNTNLKTRLQQCCLRGQHKNWRFNQLGVWSIKFEELKVRLNRFGLCIPATCVLTCRGQGCQRLIYHVHPLVCGISMGRSHHKGRDKH